MKKILTAVLLMSAVMMAQNITVKAVREEVPSFRREYTTQLTKVVRITITVRWTYSSYFGYELMKDGQLTQSDGRWVLFDPDRPADKILDRELLPLVKAKTLEILAKDREFRASKPSEFIDESGVTWVRKSIVQPRK